MEIEDPKAFIKETALLPSACELCYHTVNTSALNAEELRRENGIEVWFSAGYFQVLYLPSYHMTPHCTMPDIANHVMSCAMPCLAMPCLALPCLTLPCLALPSHALPCLALPCLTLP